MPQFPRESTDPFLAAQNAVSGTPRDDGIGGFSATRLPSQNGFSTRQSQIPNERNGVITRNMVRWFVPEVGIVEMYINPQSITYPEKKHITSQRTKGGYVLQYWGEELVPLNIQGTTGSSGVEGINVLRDVYRAEQVAFDPYALALASDRDSENNDQLSFFSDSTLGNILTAGGILSSGRSFSDLVTSAIETGAVASTRAQPTLASLAFSVEMYWSGWVYRGYFTDFSVDERADNLGLFNYSMTFVTTQRRGLRLNYMPWHRSAVSGPSNSDPDFGVPYSYTNLATEFNPPRPVQTQNENTTISDILGSAADFITGIF